jgi:DNA helicase II / ATP-dependent DNA helicase PcrA
MSKFTPSKFQLDIFDFIVNDHRNLLISAVAGSGKTTTLLKSLEIIPNDKSVLFLAFNLSISEELKSRIPKNKENIDVSTVHSFGMSILKRNFYCETNNKKYREILNAIVDFKYGKNRNNLMTYGFNEEQKTHVNEVYKLIPDLSSNKDFLKNVVRLCNLSRMSLVNFDIRSVGVIETNNIASKYGIDNNDNESIVSWHLCKIGIGYNKIIDYTDMISIPIILNLEPTKYDLVFIDESQDLNSAQRVLMMKSLKSNGGRFISVGDEKQAIYGFAGSDHESYQKLRNTPNTIELPLSYTYRVAPEIVKMVKHINPSIVAHPNNKSGVVHDVFSYKDIKDGDMVLCRNSFPVVSLCIKLLSEGKKSYVIGSDIGKSIIDLIKLKEKDEPEFTMDNVIKHLLREKEMMIEKIMSKQGITKSEAIEEQQIASFNEKIQLIESISYGMNDPYQVINKINLIFSNDEKDGIKLATIHKSKGLESERVFIIHRDLIPSKYARQPWEIEQERNLEYVAYTRAKTTLGFINDFDAFSSHKKRELKMGEIKLSKYVHPLNRKMEFTLTIKKKERKEGKFGATDFYELEDKDGVLYERWGTISPSYIVGKISNKKVDEGSIVRFYSSVTAHKEYRGIKYNRLSAPKKH